MAPDQWASTAGPASVQGCVGTCGVAASTNAVSVRVSISHPPYGVRRCTTLTTNAPLSGRASARVSGKRNRASGSVVYPEFHTTNTSSPITGIQWRSEEHTSELQSRSDLVCRLLLEKKKEQANSSEAGRVRKQGMSRFNISASEPLILQRQQTFSHRTNSTAAFFLFDVRLLQQ